MLVLFALIVGAGSKAIDLLDTSGMEPLAVNYCNDSSLLESAGLIRSTLGQFLGFECSAEFYHCRWQSDGFRTYRKTCMKGLVYDTVGTQNCNYDYNVKGCAMRGGVSSHCNSTDFHCPISETCVNMNKRCDGNYDCALEEDEQNCPMCGANEFACIVSEQCISMKRRCNGVPDCSDGTDEIHCDACGAGGFYCAKSGECISAEQKCDGAKQCPHGEDELLCKKTPNEKKFTCSSMKEKSIPLVQVCDGVAQCPDGSDEEYCEGEEETDGVAGMGPLGGNAITLSKPAPTDSSDYEEVDESSGPSFPRLELGGLNLPPLPTQPAPPAPAPAHPAPGQTQQFSKIRAESSSTADSQDRSEQAPRTRIEQPALVQVTAPPPTTTPAPETTTAPLIILEKSTPRMPSTRIVHNKIKKYPTSPVAESSPASSFAMLSSVPSSVRPKSQTVRPSMSTGVGRAQLSTRLGVTAMPTLAPSMPSSDAPSLQSSIMKKLSTRIDPSNPDAQALLAKIEAMLRQENAPEKVKEEEKEKEETKRRRKPAYSSNTVNVRSFASRISTPQW